MIPSSGQKTLSRLESLSDALPLPDLVGQRLLACAPPPAALSSRRPWYDGARRWPSCVHSANSTSQTSFGSTQTTSPLRTRGIFGTSANGDVVALERAQLREQLVDLRVGEAGADVADVLELAAAVDAEDERAEASPARRPWPFV